MPSTLIFPDGVRLAAREEVPGNATRRAEEWARIQSADIAPGFVLKPSGDARFARYAEINVDAPQIFALFGDLSAALPGPAAMLLFGAIDDEPAPIGSAPVAKGPLSINPLLFDRDNLLNHRCGMRD